MNEEKLRKWKLISTIIVIFSGLFEAAIIVIVTVSTHTYTFFNDFSSFTVLFLTYFPLAVFATAAIARLYFSQKLENLIKNRQSNE